MAGAEEGGTPHYVIGVDMTCGVCALQVAGFLGLIFVLPSSVVFLTHDSNGDGQCGVEEGVGLDLRVSRFDRNLRVTK